MCRTYWRRVGYSLRLSILWGKTQPLTIMEKTQKYAHQCGNWERNPDYQVKHYNIIIDVLGGYLADVSHAGKELVGEKSATILQRMQRSVMSNTPTKHGAQFENCCLKLKRGLLLTVLFLEKNLTIVHWNFCWKFMYDYAVDLKLSRMVDKILGQTETFLFILTF